MKLTMTQFKKYRSYIGKNNLSFMDNGRGAFACALAYQCVTLEEKLVTQRKAKEFWDSMTDNDKVELFHKMVNA